MRIGFAITRASAVDATWTTVHLAVAALARGWSVRFVEPWDYEVGPSAQLVARAHAFDRPATAEALVEALASRTAPRRFVAVDQLDLLLLRASPLDVELLAFAGLARDAGVRVVNDPDGLLRVSHKGWLAAQPGVPTPPTLVTRSRAAALLFRERQPGGVIVKPARGSGGRGVSFVSRRSVGALDDAFDAARGPGNGYVVVQPYLEEAELGEKRVIWLDGEVIGGYLRRRAEGEFRHNLKCGGTPEPTQITDRERSLVKRLSPALLRTGIRLAGLDLIGDHIIEVNALNPGGAFHADRLGGTRLADTILTRLAAPLEVGATRDPWAHPVP